VTRLQTGPSRFVSRNVQAISAFPRTSKQALGLTQPPIQWKPVSLPGVKPAVCGVDRSPSSTAEIRMSGAIPPLLIDAFMAWTGTTLISGFPRDVDVICGLLGNYTASCGN
jgi:hypothetical protein